MQICDKLEFQCVAKPGRMRSCCFKTLQLPYKMRRCLFQHVANTEYCLNMLQKQLHMQMRDFSVKMLETSWASVYYCDRIHIFACHFCFIVVCVFYALTIDSVSQMPAIRKLYGNLQHMVFYAETLHPIWASHSKLSKLFLSDLDNCGNRSAQISQKPSLRIFAVVETVCVCWTWLTTGRHLV